MGRLAWALAAAALALGPVPAPRAQETQPPANAAETGQPAPADRGAPPNEADAKPLSVFVVLDGAASGPYDRDGLLALRDSHRIWPDTLMWMQGQEGWAIIEATPDVADGLWSEKAPGDPNALAWLAGVWEPLPFTRALGGHGQGRGTGLLTIKDFGWVEIYMKLTEIGAVQPSIQVNEFLGEARAVYASPTTLLIFAKGTEYPVIDGKPKDSKKRRMTIGLTKLGPDRVMDAEGLVYRRID